MTKKVKNYLKDVKEITAPLNWKSSPDSPPTQLAYITQPEIDMLVEANIHGSMKGKPNMGPKGIISLDGTGNTFDYIRTNADWNKVLENCTNLSKSFSYKSLSVPSYSTFFSPTSYSPIASNLYDGR